MTRIPIMTETPITTAPTEAEMALARRLYAEITVNKSAVPLILAGAWDRTETIQLALAAIRETTEAAAKLADEYRCVHISKLHQGADNTARMIGRDLRANHHLPKGPNND